MNYIIKKAGISMMTGAAYMFGSWITKHVLEKTNQEISNRQKKQKESDPA